MPNVDEICNALFFCLFLFPFFPSAFPFVGFFSSVTLVLVCVCVYLCVNEREKEEERGGGGYHREPLHHLKCWGEVKVTGVNHLTVSSSKEQ